MSKLTAACWPNVSGDEVEAYLLANGLVEKTDREAGVPTNGCGCS